MKVYIATSGSYSDYRIDQVFLNEEDARAYAETQREGDWDEWEVSEGPVERRTRFRLTWHTDRPESAGRFSNPWTTAYPEDYDGNNRPECTWSKTFSYVEENRRDILRVEGWSEEEVLKVYSDQRAIYKAREQGIS
jgi:hypothetical protein